MNSWISGPVNPRTRDNNLRARIMDSNIEDCQFESLRRFYFFLLPINVGVFKLMNRWLTIPLLSFDETFDEICTVKQEKKVISSEFEEIFTQSFSQNSVSWQTKKISWYLSIHFCVCRYVDSAVRFKAKISVSYL